MRVLFAGAFYEGPPDIEQGVLGAGIELTVHRTRRVEDVPKASWAACDALIVGVLPIGQGIIDLMPACRGISSCSTGTDHIDVAAAARSGIPVCNVPDHATAEVADFAIGLMLNLVRGVATLDRLARRRTSGDWFLTLPTQKRLKGMRIGIVGLGLIGMATAKRAAAFDTEVGFHDPFLRDGIDVATGYRRFDRLDDLLGWADVVSLHVALTGETRNLMNASRLAAMKPGALLINVARGAVVDLDALHQALKNGHLAGAATDVLPHEPPDERHPLIKAWREEAPWLDGRFLATPHCAYYSDEEIAHLRYKAAAHAVALLMGEIPMSCVNRDMLGSVRSPSAPTPA